MTEDRQPPNLHHFILRAAIRLHAVVRLPVDIKQVFPTELSMQIEILMLYMQR